MILQRLKTSVSRDDSSFMDTLGGPLWVVIAVITGASVISILHCAATSVRNTTYLHDLRVRVAGLRKEKLERLKALAESAGHEAPAPPARRAA
jgi:hypothetical protein